jgi:hypothetical protein
MPIIRVYLSIKPCPCCGSNNIESRAGVINGIPIVNLTCCDCSLCIEKMQEDDIKLVEFWNNIRKHEPEKTEE